MTDALKMEKQERKSEPNLGVAGHLQDTPEHLHAGYLAG